jgi:hypothetical protein
MMDLNENTGVMMKTDRRRRGGLVNPMTARSPSVIKVAGSNTVMA